MKNLALPGKYSVEVEIAFRMVFTAVLIGTATAVLGTGRVTLPLVASGALCWSFVPVLQLLTGLLFVRGARGSRTRALARYFAADTYWSTWILAYAAVLLLVPQPGRFAMYLMATAVLPLLLTARALVHVRRNACGDSPQGASRIVAAHQALTILLFLGYVMWASALWPRIMRVLGA